MRVQAPQGAPEWAHDLARSATQAFDNAIWPFVQRAPITVAQLAQIAASRHPWKKYFVSDGTGGMTEVTSNGTNWKYPDGTMA